MNRQSTRLYQNLPEGYASLKVNGPHMQKHGVQNTEKEGKGVWACHAETTWTWYTVL